MNSRTEGRRLNVRALSQGEWHSVKGDEEVIFQEKRLKHFYLSLLPWHLRTETKRVYPLGLSSGERSFRVHHQTNLCLREASLC